MPPADPPPAAVRVSSVPDEASTAFSPSPSVANRQTEGLIAAICLLGLLVTSLGVWTAVRTDHDSEKRLLETQTRQAATVLEAAVTAINHPMIAALEIQASVLPERRRVVFVRGFSRYVGAGKPFVSASLWQTSANAPKQVASVGVAPALDPTSRTSKSFIRHAVTANTSVVKRVVVGEHSRIAYALADVDTGSVIYAERAIPANRRAPVDKHSAYAGLDYAIYLGTRTDTSNMTTTDVDPVNLPLTGTTFKTLVPFGDTVLTMVARPRRHLSGDMSQRMPWYVLVAGLLLTGTAATLTRQVLRSRNRAQTDTQTITTLYEKVDALYGEQRELAIDLQRALLPRIMPNIAGLEVAAAYVAGAKGIDIGGDWYSLIGTGNDNFAFVVGDVSGHGVDAVAEMARARFTVRAYLVDGDPPNVALEKCSRQFDISTDGHIVTVIAGVGNVRTGEFTVANAGHPKPLLIAENSSAEFVETTLGPPLGVGASTYLPTTFKMAPNSTLVCYTDGLIERRGEDIDTGLHRLAHTARGSEHTPSQDLEAFVSGLLERMHEDEDADDIAVLAFKRVQP